MKKEEKRTGNGRGWDNRSQAKPAAEYEFRYGSGLLKKESAGWPRTLVVTTPSAYRTARPYLSRQPAGVACVRWLDWDHLHETSRQLPDDAGLVIGLGGGRAVDAAKFVALEKGLPLITVPTIASTGAIIHGVCAKWKGREPVQDTDWPWVDCEYVLVDYDLVLEAPYYLNTAGLGDILCGYAGLAEWRWRARNGQGPACDEAAMATVIRHHEAFTRKFEETLDGERNLTADSVHHIMTCLQERDGRALRHPGMRSGDHYFLIALEFVNNRSWIHGELVALGALLIAWLCDAQPEDLIERLERCRVRRRPTEMELGREQLRRGLAFVPDYMAQRDIDSILRHEPVQGARFEALWEFLEGF